MPTKMVTIKQQRGITYTGKRAGGGGSLVGPGASPASAPALALAVGTGLSVGQYQYAYTDVTASGESLPSPLGTITPGVMAPPAGAPTLTVQVGTGLGTGVYQYAYSDVTAAGETLPSPLGTITTGVLAPPAIAPSVAILSGAGIENGVHGYAYSDVTAAGETVPSPIASVTHAPTQAAPNAIGSAVVNPFGTGPLTINTNFSYAYTFKRSSDSAETTISPTTTFNSGPNGQNATVPLAGCQAAPAGWTRQWYRTKAAGGTFYQIPAGFMSESGGNFNENAADSNLSATTAPTSNATAVNRSSLSAIAVGPTGTTARKIWRTVAGGSQLKLLTTLADNTTTTYTDSTPDGSLGANAPTTNTAAAAQVAVSAIAVGISGVTSRKVYRTVVGGSQLKLLTTLADNVTTSYVDSTPDGSLGADAPTVGTALAQQVSLSGIAIGASPTTSRKVYRTAVGGSQLKLLTTLLDNVTTTFADSTADGSLGANAPTSDTSLLIQPSGQVLAGATSILVAGAGAFDGGGGYAILGNGQLIIRYTGISGNTLTGIPATGVGSLASTVTYGTSITDSPVLTGIPASGPGSIIHPINAGDEVNLLVQEDDLAAQATLAALLSVSLPGSTGVKSSYVVDGRISETEARARAVARLAASRQVDTTIWYDCRDINSQSGATISVDLLDAPGGPVVGDFTIQTVEISLFSATAGNISPLYPTYSVEASTRRFSLEDLLRRALAAAPAP